jgi:Fe-S-cluster containining protein
MAESEDAAELPASAFVAWLDATERSLRGEIDADVPCDGCTACCRSSQFVHIAPDEADTLAHIPRALLFPAPRMEQGNVVLGYDENGCCPMLGDSGCSIYEHRPRACRTYDCRVFAAAGVEPDDKPLVATRVRRWRFAYPSDADRDAHDALRAIAAEMDDNEAATARALSAIQRFSRERG